MSLTKHTRCRNYSYVVHRCSLEFTVMVADLHFLGVACDTVNKGARGQWVEACRPGSAPPPTILGIWQKLCNLAGLWVCANMCSCLTKLQKLAWNFVDKYIFTGAHSIPLRYKICTTLIQWPGHLQHYMRTSVTLEPLMTSREPIVSN